MSEKTTPISAEVRELVKARLETMPPSFRLSIGNEGSFSKKELLEHVTKGDAIGQEVIRIQLSFIKAVARGDFSRMLTES